MSEYGDDVSNEVDDDDEGGPVTFLTSDGDGLAQFKRVSYLMIPPGCTNIDNLVEAVDSLGPEHNRSVSKVCITHARGEGAVDVDSAPIQYPVAILLTCEHDIGQLIANQAQREASYEGIKLKVAMTNGHDVILAAVKALASRRKPRPVGGMNSVTELFNTIIQVHAQPSLTPDPIHVQAMLSWYGLGIPVASTLKATTIPLEGTSLSMALTHLVRTHRNEFMWSNAIHGEYFQNPRQHIFASNMTTCAPNASLFEIYKANPAIIAYEMEVIKNTIAFTPSIIATNCAAYVNVDSSGSASGANQSIITNEINALGDRISGQIPIAVMKDTAAYFTREWTRTGNKLSCGDLFIQSITKAITPEDAPASEYTSIAACITVIATHMMNSMNPVQEYRPLGILRGLNSCGKTGIVTAAFTLVDILRRYNISPAMIISAGSPVSDKAFLATMMKPTIGVVMSPAEFSDSINGSSRELSARVHNPCGHIVRETVSNSREVKTPSFFLSSFLGPTASHRTAINSYEASRSAIFITPPPAPSLRLNVSMARPLSVVISLASRCIFYLSTLMNFDVLKTNIGEQNKQTNTPTTFNMHKVVNSIFEATPRQLHHIETMQLYFRVIQGVILALISGRMGATYNDTIPGIISYVFHYLISTQPEPSVIIMYRQFCCNTFAVPNKASEALYLALTRKWHANGPSLRRLPNAIYFVEGCQQIVAAGLQTSESTKNTQGKTSIATVNMRIAGSVSCTAEIADINLAKALIESRVNSPPAASSQLPNFVQIPLISSPADHPYLCCLVTPYVYSWQMSRGRTDFGPLTRDDSFLCVPTYIAQLVWWASHTRIYGLYESLNRDAEDAPAKRRSEHPIGSIHPMKNSIIYLLGSTVENQLSRNIVDVISSTTHEPSPQESVNGTLYPLPIGTLAMRGHLAFYASKETCEYALQDERLSMSHPWIANAIAHPFANSVRITIPAFFKTFSVSFT